MSAEIPETEPQGNAPPPDAAGLVERLREMAANPANRFVVLFLVYLGALAWLYPKASIRFAGAVDFMSALTARLGGASLALFSDAIQYREKLIFYGGFAVEIIEECTGLYEMLIYAAAVMAFPTTLVKKGIGLLFGIPTLYAINVARIVFLVWVGRFYPDVFDFMHLYFWQATLILMITSVWLLWIFKVVRRENPPHAA